MVTFAHGQPCPDGSDRVFDGDRGTWVEPYKLTKHGPFDPPPPPREPRYDFAHAASQDAVAAVLDARQHTHGDYTDHAAVTQNLKRVMAGTSRWGLLHDHERETLEMIAHKIGRILSGNPHFNDHWLDIAGYAKLSADRNPVK